MKTSNMIKTSNIWIGLGALLPLTATASHAAPSSVGPTGLLNVPTTDTVPVGRFQAMLAYDRLKVGGTKISVAPIVNLEHGFGRGEVGISYFNVRGNASVKAFNAKYLLAPESAKSPAIAAGVIYLNGNTSETDLYLVTSYLFGKSRNVRATGGLLYQRPNSTSTNHFTGMAGIEFGNPQKTSFGIDYIADDVAAGRLLGAVLRQRITPDITAQIGVGNHSRLFAGVTAEFGGK
ncbi:Exopolysaccharide biosynthesis protein YbjH [Abditibacterium utsteinense]|uniref:Exopolysaccharide biosynthesis protein YbjH n=1 Tax=Abditibacterium utsteinense TaxID=1960156 RepID=A0A2S8SXN1_9BACT|nr:YjbH domain-containing protein [Abditibacterium utsteinense]PQV65562.1 Exopolysaccharide biosynthesis protein YbjH [Abditibacterium utsteinense]